MTDTKKGDGNNYTEADYTTIDSRRLQRLTKSEVERFKDAPIVVTRKSVRDALNSKIVKGFAEKTRQKLHLYHAQDRFQKRRLSDFQQERMWKVRSTFTKDALGQLPLVPGMRVMITENVAIGANVVNGAEGVLKDIKYEEDHEGRRFAVCAYVHISGCCLAAPGLEPEVVPIVPVKTSFQYSQVGHAPFSISRTQLPLLPAYAYTDYKSQGRSLPLVLLDLTGCNTLQSLYVMLSRATSLQNLAVIRWFSPAIISKRLSAEFRSEFERLQLLDMQTETEFETRFSRSLTPQL
jgi:ATP-dependent exoDNAse (exonuclease V) alpha subunit